MGGFLVYVPSDQVTDVDMTVEEAARALITSGIAGGQVDHADRSVELFRGLETVTPEPVSDVIGDDSSENAE